MCLRALLQNIALDAVLCKYINGLTWEKGWLSSVCASWQYDQTLFFRISSEMGVHN